MSTSYKMKHRADTSLLCQADKWSPPSCCSSLRQQLHLLSERHIRVSASDSSVSSLGRTRRPPQRSASGGRGEGWRSGVCPRVKNRPEYSYNTCHGVSAVLHSESTQALHLIIFVIGINIIILFDSGSYFSQFFVIYVDFLVYLS